MFSIIFILATVKQDDNRSITTGGKQNKLTIWYGTSYVFVQVLPSLLSLLKKTSYIAAVYRWILIVGYCLHLDSLYVEISLGADSVNIFNLCTLVAQIRSLVAYRIAWPSSLITSLQRCLFASPEQYDGQDERALRPYSHTFFMLVFRELGTTPSKMLGQKQLFVAWLLFSL